MSDQNDPTNVTVTSQNSTSPAQAGQTGQQPVNWEALFQSEEARRKGLQTALNREQEKWSGAKQQTDALIAALTQEKLETERALKALQTEFDGTKTQVGDYELKLKTAEATAATAAKGLERYRKVARVGLVEEEEQGLLRTDLEGEEFDKHLEAFVAKLGKSAQKMAMGTTPAGGAARTPPESIDALKTRVFAAQLAGDTAAYNQLYDELVRRMKQGE